jgi:hypothetical protein
MFCRVGTIVYPTTYAITSVVRSTVDVGCFHWIVRGYNAHVKRGPNRAFMTEFAYIKEGSLGSEPLGGGVEAAATR